MLLNNSISTLVTEEVNKSVLNCIGNFHSNQGKDLTSIIRTLHYKQKRGDFSLALSVVHRFLTRYGDQDFGLNFFYVQ